MSFITKTNKFTIYSILFFYISYLINMNFLKKMEFLPFLFLLAGSFIMFLRKNHFNSSLNHYHIYIILYTLILAISLVMSAFFSIKPMFSLLRIFITILIFIISFYFFWQLCDSLFIQKRNMKIWEVAFALFFVLIIIGQLIIPDWKSGISGIRLSGGTNPNFVSFFAFFIMITTHFYSIGNGWSKRRVFLYILSLIIIVWSMSRSVLLSVGVLWLSYGMFLALKQINFLIKGKFKRNRLAFPLVIIAGGVFSFLLWEMFKQLTISDVIFSRLTSSGGWETRMAAWKVLWPYFTNNIWFGTAGWWNATHILDEKWQPGMATSPHNLYIRLLAEVGIVGTIMIISLPVVLIFLLLLKCLREYRVNLYYNQNIFLTSTLLALLIGQFFEDRYLVGIAGLGNSIVIFCFVLCFHYLIKGAIPVMN